MSESDFYTVSERYEAQAVRADWPAWELRGHGSAAPPRRDADDHPDGCRPPETADAAPSRLDPLEPWVSARLTFSDGARIDVLVTVEDDGITVEDLRADPPLPLSGLATLAHWIEGPLDDACRIATGRTRRPRPVPAPATDPSALSGPRRGGVRGSGGAGREEARGAVPSAGSEPEAGDAAPSASGIAAGPATERATDRPADPPAEPTAAHSAEAAADPGTASTADSVTAPVVDPGTAAEAEPGTVPAADPEAAPAADPAAEPAVAAEPAAASASAAAAGSPAVPAAHQEAAPHSDPVTDPSATPPPEATPGPAPDTSDATDATGPDPSADPSDRAETSSSTDRTTLPEGRALWGRGGDRSKAVAAAYREAQREGRDPVEAVMNATGRGRRRALRLIAGARDAGLLSPRHHRRQG
ncbi:MULTISPECIES: DUF6214 family protein [Streptomyces]|uniref:DUF6214 family protein n=1 Tax=Streptomyces ramulosus TaxID=47762 RepID=A0ABW1FFR3_9ACTN